MKIKNHIKTDRIISISIVYLLLAVCITPVVLALNIDRIEGFDKGPSYQSVVPLKKVTFVNYDENSFLDDYAYLASVPTSVFNDGDKLFSYPLLFYQDEYPINGDDKYRTLNARQGIDYFLEDWMSYCNGQTDHMTLINVPESKLDSSWKSKEYTIIESNDPYKIANNIALNEWSYSDNAVIAVVNDNYEVPETKSKGTLHGTIPNGFNIYHESFEMKEPEIGVGGSYQSFDVGSPYKYIVANMYWPNVGIDLDLQLYDDQLGMADASSKWNVLSGAGETVSSYIYNYGKWEVGITYMPTQSIDSDDGVMKSMFQNVNENNGILSRLNVGSRISSIASRLGLGNKLGIFGNGGMQTVDINLYPGIEIELNEPVPFGCRDVEFTLKWNNQGVSLGFAVLDTFGAETASTPSDDEIKDGADTSINERTIRIKSLGETTEEEKYTMSVFALNDVNIPIDFSIEYSWQQNMTRLEGDCLASATEGAVLASMINSPLIYASTDDISYDTINTLYTLGVKNIYLINLGNHLSKDTAQKIKNIAKTKEFTEYKDVYDIIRKITGKNDVIFSTIDPWSYFYGGERKPAGEDRGSLFIGPAAFIAAHHGSPVLLVDNHPELSQSVVYHTNFWRDTSHLKGRSQSPSVACMILTGTNVMNFLDEYGYVLPKDKENLVTMITVADQFDIGATWDRTFTGALIPGRFCGSPVDTAYWISRSVFYPALIFENPALQGQIQLINGSKSVIKPIIGKFMEPKGTDLVIVKPSQEEDFIYPILHTYNVYLHNFNRDASKHWGGMYTAANGITPYETPSPYSIDDGLTDKTGSYYPDMTETEVTPIYATKAGYSNCFSTRFEETVENLNRGVIMWMEACHGGSRDFGVLAMWNDESPYVDEVNPWRAYEKILLSPSNFRDFIDYIPELMEDNGIKLPNILITLSKLFKITIVPIDLMLVDRGCTEDPDVAVMNPDVRPSLFVDSFGVDFHVKESHGLSLIPIIGRKYRSYGDGVVIDPLMGGENVITSKTGLEFDDALDNLHSCGLNAVSCVVSYTYLHYAMIRHGTTYQIMDPWSTSWYSGLWLHGIPRHLALGNTIGQAYEHGMSEVGIQYLVDQWWWDLAENVVFFGDPDIRVWTPSTEWDTEAKNYWEQEDVLSLRYDKKLDIDGHTPFGATSYPHKINPFNLLDYLPVIIGILIVSISLIGIYVYTRKKKKCSKK